MADKNAEVAVEDNGGMKKTLSLWNFFTIGFGAIIGTGWVLQVGDWMVVGGGPVPAMIAFLLGAIFLVPVGAVFGELTAAIPISGGIVEYVDRSFGRTMSYITGWLLALGNGILCPWEAIAISTLVSEMFGSLPGLEWLRAVKLYYQFTRWDIKINYKIAHNLLPLHRLRKISQKVVPKMSFLPGHFFAEFLCISAQRICRFDALHKYASTS